MTTASKGSEAPVRLLARALSRELTEEELSLVAGGNGENAQWDNPYDTDTASGGNWDDCDNHPKPRMDIIVYDPNG